MPSRTVRTGAAVARPTRMPELESARLRDGARAGTGAGAQLEAVQHPPGRSNCRRRAAMRRRISGCQEAHAPPRPAGSPRSPRSRMPDDAGHPGRHGDGHWRAGEHAELETSADAACRRPRPGLARGRASAGRRRSRRCARPKAKAGPDRCAPGGAAPVAGTGAKPGQDQRPWLERHGLDKLGKLLAADCASSTAGKPQLNQLLREKRIVVAAGRAARPHWLAWWTTSAAGQGVILLTPSRARRSCRRRSTALQTDGSRWCSAGDAGVQNDGQSTG